MYGGPLVQNTFAKSNTRLQNPIRVCKTQYTFAKVNTRLQKWIRVCKIEYTFAKSKYVFAKPNTRLQNAIHVCKSEYAFAKSNTRLQNPIRVGKTQYTFAKCNTCLQKWIRVCKIEYTFAKSNTCLQNPIHVCKSEYVFAKYNTRLQKWIRVCKMEYTFAKSNTCLQNPIHVCKIQYAFAKSNTRLQNPRYHVMVDLVKNVLVDDNISLISHQRILSIRWYYRDSIIKNTSVKFHLESENRLLAPKHGECFLILKGQFCRGSSKLWTFRYKFVLFNYIGCLNSFSRDALSLARICSRTLACVAVTSEECRKKRHPSKIPSSTAYDVRLFRDFRYMLAVSWRNYTLHRGLIQRHGLNLQTAHLSPHHH